MMSDSPAGVRRRTVPAQHLFRGLFFLLTGFPDAAGEGNGGGGGSGGGGGGWDGSAAAAFAACPRHGGVSDVRLASVTALQQTIEQHGGVVCDGLHAVRAAAAALALSAGADDGPAGAVGTGSVVVVGCPSSYRTLKFLLAVALGSAPVHANWVLHSVDARQLLPPAPYVGPLRVCMCVRLPVFTLLFARADAGTTCQCPLQGRRVCSVAFRVQ
jgi:hypothetical protein